MTYLDILNRFNKEFPNAEVDDFRPAYEGFTKDKVGITVWLKNGDIIEYYPNVPSISEEVAKQIQEEPVRNPLVYHGCFACSSRETCPDAFWSTAVHCNAYGRGEDK